MGVVGHKQHSFRFSHTCTSYRFLLQISNDNLITDLRNGDQHLNGHYSTEASLRVDNCLLKMEQEIAEKVAILDSGAQYGKVIDRRVRESNVYSETLPLSTTAKELAEKKFK